jgi:uncharacterized membrane protein
MRFGRIFYIIVILVCAFEIARLWSITPAQMAAHFNVAGDPDRFVPKEEFFWYQVQTMLIVFAVSLPPQIIFLVLPVNFINMPNREYWFAPERRDQTRDQLSAFGAMMFGIILLAVQAAFEISAYANLITPIHFNAQLMLVIMVAAFITIVYMLFRLARSFRLPASNN